MRAIRGGAFYAGRRPSGIAIAKRCDGLANRQRGGGMGDDQLAVLRHKYDPVVRLMHQLGVQVQTVDLAGGKLRLRGQAPSEDVKNKIWNQIKAVDPLYSDLDAEITVVAGAGAATGAASTAGGGSYTV